MNKQVINDENRRIGQMMKQARRSKGLTQSDMTRATKLSKNHISAVERGVNGATVSMLIGYSEMLGMTPDEILQYKETETPKVIPRLQRALARLTEEEQQKALIIIEQAFLK